MHRIRKIYLFNSRARNYYFWRTKDRGLIRVCCIYENSTVVEVDYFLTFNICCFHLIFILTAGILHVRIFFNSIVYLKFDNSDSNDVPTKGYHFKAIDVFTQITSNTFVLINNNKLYILLLINNNKLKF